MALGLSGINFNPQPQENSIDSANRGFERGLTQAQAVRSIQQQAALARAQQVQAQAEMEEKKYKTGLEFLSNPQFKNSTSPETKQEIIKRSIIPYLNKTMGTNIDPNSFVYTEKNSNRIDNLINLIKNDVPPDIFQYELALAYKEAAGDKEQTELIGNLAKAGKDPKNATVMSFITEAISDGVIDETERQKLNILGEAFRTVYPQFVKDGLGRTYSVTGTGGVSPVFGGNPGSEAAEGTNALLNLRQAYPQLANRLDKIVDTTLPDKNQIMKAYVEGNASAKKIIDILNAEEGLSQVGLRSLGFYFARLSGSNSQLSDAEREQFEQPLSFIGRIQNKGYRVAKGDLSPQMKEDLKRLSKYLINRNKKEAQSIIDSKKEVARRTLGPLWNDNIATIFPTFEGLSSAVDFGLEENVNAESEADSYLEGL